MGKFDSPRKGLNKIQCKPVKRGKGRPRKGDKLLKPVKSVGKKSSGLVKERPKRQIVPKNKELTAGLSWKEEKELQKALYASLHETTSTSLPTITTEHRTIPRQKIKLKRGRKKGLKLFMPSKDSSKSNVEHNNGSIATCSTTNSNSTSVSGQATPTCSEDVQRHGPKVDGCRVRAQRKFAQGSLPSSPCVTPVKQQSRVPSPVKFMVKKPPKTEDFIQFLCLRGSSILPKHLEFFSHCDPKLFTAMNTPVKSNSTKGSRPTTPVSNSNGNMGVTHPKLVPRGRGRPCKEDTSTDGDDLGVRPLVNKAYASCYAQPCTAGPSYTDTDSNVAHQSATATMESLVEAKAHAALTQPMRLRSSTRNHADDGSNITSGDSMVPKSLQTPVKNSANPPQGISNASLSYLSHKSCPKSPRTVKKERGKKLVRKARETIARRERNRQSICERKTHTLTEGHVEVDSEGRRLTRKLRERIESEKFQEAKLQALYSNKNVDGLVISEKHPSKRHKQLELPDISPPKRSRRSLQLDDVSSTSSAKSFIDLTLPSPKLHEKHHHRSRSAGQKSAVASLMEGEVESSRTLRSSPHRVSNNTEVPVTRSPARHLVEKRGKSPGRASETSDMSDSGKTKSHKSCKRLSLPQVTSGLRQGFPLPSQPAQIVPAPNYHPSTEQFQDPIQYIESIKADAQPFGLCSISPPQVWKPECCVSQELRFITEVQHLHKMKNRWGPNVQEMECIRKHLALQGHRFESPPVIGGIELDLPALSKAISQCGGIQAVADDKRKWMKVADILRIPKWAQDRSFKLYDAYCKFLLSFDTLTSQEKEKLQQQVLNDKNKGRLNMDCVLKGKSRSLAEFFNSARSTLVRWFDGLPSSAQVETEYWKILDEQKEHVAVHSAHVDTKHCGGGFPNKKDSPYSKHGWNFNVLQHNDPYSVLKHLGLVSGVTIPELHMGMLFSTNCWCSDPHGLPYISYLHTGGDIIWYCIPKSEELKFKQVLQDLAPDLIDADSPIWLPVDSIMLSPEDLVSAGVSVCRIIQKQGEFMVVFPQSFTATICVGYNISESIRFATAEWIPTGYTMSLALHESCEPELFSMDQLLIRLANNDKITGDILYNLMSPLEDMINKEIALRQKLEGAGLKTWERLNKDRSPDVGRKKRGVNGIGSEEENRCEVSKKICYLSMVLNESDMTVYSLEHAFPLIYRKKNIKQYRMLYRHTEKELLDLLEKVRLKFNAVTSTKDR